MAEVKKRGRPPKKDAKINYADIYSYDMNHANAHSYAQSHPNICINPSFVKCNYSELDNNNAQADITSNEMPKKIYNTNKLKNNEILSRSIIKHNDGHSYAQSQNIKSFILNSKQEKPSYITDTNNKYIRETKITNNIILHLKISKDKIEYIEKNIKLGLMNSNNLSSNEDTQHIFEQHNINGLSFILNPEEANYTNLNPKIFLKKNTSSESINGLQDIPHVMPVIPHGMPVTQNVMPVTSHVMPIIPTTSRSNYTSNLSEQNKYENINNLLINTGVNYTIHKIMANFYNSSNETRDNDGNEPGTWPASTLYCCWYCCHTFSETPVGIPEKIIIENNNICFELAGNFCSYNCAYSYINPQSADDLAGINIGIDYVHSDDKSNKIQLLELLCSLECGIPFLKKIKPAPPRLSLKSFGGPLDIIAFRANFNLHSEFHIFKYPVVPITYSLGELKNISRNLPETSADYYTKDKNPLKKAANIDYTSIEYICKIWENKCNNKSNSYSFKK